MGLKDAREAAVEGRSMTSALQQACSDRMYGRPSNSSLHTMVKEKCNQNKHSASSIAGCFAAVPFDDTPKSIMDTIKMKELRRAHLGSGESVTSKDPASGA